MLIFIRKILFLVLIITIYPIYAGSPDRSSDKHYNKVGFFDIHFCNWPDRKPFIMVLFSTLHYNDIKKIEIFSPDNKKISDLDLSRFRIITTKDKKTKKVFIKQVPINETFKNGWHKSIVTLNSGEKITAYDFVEYTLMGIIKKTVPVNKSEDNELSGLLKWNKLKGAKFYQVFINDLWQDGKLVYISKLLNKNEIQLPKGLIEPGGYYGWRVHARDINEDPILGDFNHGSLSEKLTFTVRD